MVCHVNKAIEIDEFGILLLYDFVLLIVRIVYLYSMAFDRCHIGNWNAEHISKVGHQIAPAASNNNMDGWKQLRSLNVYAFKRVRAHYDKIVRDDTFSVQEKEQEKKSKRRRIEINVTLQATDGKQKGRKRPAFFLSLKSNFPSFDL